MDARRIEAAANIRFNASSLGALCFVMIQLVPVRSFLTADSIQHRQHHRLYTCLGGIAVLNFAVSALLLITGTADYIETLPAGLFILAAVLLTIFVNLVKYMHASKSKADRLLLLGLLLAILCVLIESVSVYYVVLISGLFVSAGMLILFFVNIIRTIKNVQNMEQQRREAEILRSRQQTENMYLQMIQTLAATVEAKDTYTRGHSLRVAEYAAQLAGELGWTDTDINNLKKAVALHDIGKIGIPDQIWNKPTRLTDDEYAPGPGRHTVIRRRNLDTNSSGSTIFQKSSAATMSATMAPAIRTVLSAKKFRSTHGLQPSQTAMMR